MVEAEGDEIVLERDLSDMPRFAVEPITVIYLENFVVLR